MSRTPSELIELLVREVVNGGRVETVTEGERVVARFTCSATHLGPWRGHEPTGRRFVAIDEVYFFTVDGGRIAAGWGIEDTLGRFRQLGLPPGQAPA